MTREPIAACVHAIHNSGCRFVLAATGGGASALTELLAAPGSSRSMLECIVPYSHAALCDFLSGFPDQACSESTARCMAMAALMRARRLAPNEDPASLVGVACTASLATDRAKQGDHRVFIAAQTFQSTCSYSLVFRAKDRLRAEEEQLAARLAILGLAKGCEVDSLARDALASRIAESLLPDEAVAGRLVVAAHGWPELMLGNKAWAYGSETSPAEGPTSTPKLVFPGSFNPPHEGHAKMAQFAEQQVGQRLAWELSVANVDKPMLDYAEILDRVEALRSLGDERPTLLTLAPTFREKAKLFPGAVFVIGADTLNRIADPAYYNGDDTARDQAIDQIIAAKCSFLVFGRIQDDNFQTVSDAKLPDRLASISTEISEREFREDVSSTELRKGAY